MGRWPPTRRQVAQAVVLGGLSYRRAAEELHLSTYAVRLHIHAVNAVFEGGRWWDAFYRHFPRSSGFGAFSRAVVNDARDEALIYFEHRFDGLGGWGRVFRLRRREGQWAVIEESQLWIS